MNTLYALVDVFTVPQAVQILTGIFKAVTPEEATRVEMISGQLNRAIESGKLPAIVNEVQTYRRVGMRRIKIDDDTDYRPQVPSGVTRTYCVNRPDLLTWCEQNSIRPPLLFPDPPPADRPAADDLSSYHTPALDAMRAAIRQFWLNPDHHCPPKSTDIVEWLMRQFGIMKAMAEAIDRVIRPENRRQGGNTKRDR